MALCDKSNSHATTIKIIYLYMHLYLLDTACIFVFVSMPHESEIFCYQTSPAIYLLLVGVGMPGLARLSQPLRSHEHLLRKLASAAPPYPHPTPHSLSNLFTLPYGPLASTQSTG